jgi:hypothetical protein
LLPSPRKKIAPPPLSPEAALRSQFAIADCPKKSARDLRLHKTTNLEFPEQAAICGVTVYGDTRHARRRLVGV